MDGTTGSRSGFSVSGAGDVNGDGYADVIVGAYRADPNGKYSGSSYVVFGKASGFDAAMDLSSLDGSNGFRLDGADAYNYSGISVSNAGDVNGDGFDDVIVGGGYAYDRYLGLLGSGPTYVVFGKASGFDATLDLSSLDGNNGFRLGSDDSVSSAGDVNSDGFDDLIVGANFADPNGSSYVIFGRSDFSSRIVIEGTPGDDNLIGTAAAEIFKAGDGDDTLIGNSGADVFQGENGDDVIRVPDLDFQSMDGGAGIDTFEVTGSGIDLNLANFHDTINGIETIDLAGSGDNTLEFTLPDLLSLSDTTQIFTVDGNAGDSVVGVYGSGWADGGIDGNYHIYSNRGTVVRIDVDVSANVINLSSLNGSNGFRLDGVAEYDYSGSPVSSAGDVNGDGFDDVIVGAHLADPNGDRSGSSYVVFGKAGGFDATMDLSSLDGSNGFRLDGEEAGDESGSSVSNAGDVNGDGFDDVIVGAYGANPNGNYSGSSYVVFGKASGFDATLTLSSLDGSNGFRLDGKAERDYSGSSVSSAGDVNGDGFADLIVGASGADPNGDDSGSSYVVFGKAGGFDATMDLSSLDGSNGFRLDGNKRFDYSGRSVSSAGDVNGDGFDDVIVGADRAYPNGDRFAGSSYVVFGKASGFDATLTLSSLDGSNGFRLDGVTESDSSGTSVSNAGDVNGDGFDDVIVGAPGADANGSLSGSSYVVFGKAAGFAAVMDLSSLDGSNGFRLDGVAAGDRSGESVSNAGDVNGDGFADLIVDASSADPNGNASGSSYVVFGKAGGFDATLDLSSLDSNDGFRLDGVSAYDYSGTSVSSAGDVNGDGFDDLIVGASGANPNGENSGSSYVIFGRSDFGGGPTVIEGTPDDDSLIGTSAAEIFEAGDGDDTLIGRGGADVFHGGAGNDNIRVADLSFQSMDGGSGKDILHLTGKNMNLDLADFGDRISGIETICLYGNGDNTLTLTTAADLLNLSDTNILKVNGNAGDHIAGLSSGWTDGGIRPDGYFHIYTQGDAVLLVGVNVTTDFA